MLRFTLILFAAVASGTLFATSVDSQESLRGSQSHPESGTPLGSAAGPGFRLSGGAVLPGRMIAPRSTGESGDLRAPGIGIAAHSQSASGAIHLSGAVMQDVALRLAPEAGTLASLTAGVSLLWVLQQRRRSRY